MEQAVEETDVNVALMILYHICINSSPIEIFKKAVEPFLLWSSCCNKSFKFFYCQDLYHDLKIKDVLHSKG